MNIKLFFFIIYVTTSLIQANEIDRARIRRWQQRSWYTKLAVMPIRMINHCPYATSCFIGCYVANKTCRHSYQSLTTVGGITFLGRPVIYASTKRLLDALDVPSIQTESTYT